MTHTFYVSAAVAIIATAMAITRSNGVHALLYLIVSFLAVALVFFVMGAPFIAALEVIIYAGAIMVLFIFAAMMFNLGQQAVPQERYWIKPRMWIVPSLLAAILLAQLIALIFAGGGRSLAAGVATPPEVGIALFAPYLLGVELASLLLLSGLVGAYHIGGHLRGSDAAP